MNLPKTVALAAAAVALVGSLACRKQASTPTGGQETGGAVEVWPGMMTTVGELANEWKAPWRNGGFLLKKGKRPERHVRRVATCADLSGLVEDDFVPGPEWERYNFREQSILCRVLEAVMAARPARVDHVRELVNAEDPGDLLPASVAPPALPAQAGRAATSWHAVDPTLKLDREGARPGYREWLAHGAYNGRVTWWAAGDFDGDGFEDAVLFVNLSPAPGGDGGAGATTFMRAVVLTRRQAGGPVTVVKLFE